MKKMVRKALKVLFDILTVAAATVCVISLGGGRCFGLVAGCHLCGILGVAVVLRLGEGLDIRHEGGCEQMSYIPDNLDLFEAYDAEREAELA